MRYAFFSGGLGRGVVYNFLQGWGWAWEMGGILDLGQENPENLPGYPHELCPIPYRLW